MVALTSAPALAAGPTLSGLHRVDGAGIVEFSVVDGQVTGRLKHSAACEQLESNGVVVSGGFEGSLLVGTVAACQVGAGCAPVKRHPYLGFWVDGGLVGTVKADPGCSVLGLSRGALRITPAVADERPTAGDVGAGRGTRAQAVEAATTEATALVKERRFAEALSVLREAQALDPESVSLLYQLGLAHLNLKQPRLAVEPLRRAAGLALGGKLPHMLVGQIHFKLACALAQDRRSREAVEALTQGFDYAGERGFTLDELITDPELEPLRREGDFKKLAAKIRLAGKPKGKSPR